MEGMRQWLRGSLGRSLSAMRAEDRLAAAWPVAEGLALAGHGTVMEFAEGVVTIEVTDANWEGQMRSMGEQLRGEMARISGVTVSGIHFKLKSNLREFKKDDVR